MELKWPMLRVRFGLDHAQDMRSSYNRSGIVVVYCDELKPCEN
jgi:hypothetical protein